MWTVRPAAVIRGFPRESFENASDYLSEERHDPYMPGQTSLLRML